MGVAFVITVWVVRQLGPTNYGLLAYALSIVAMIDVVASMGFRIVLVRELVETPEQEADLVGTALAVKVVGSLLAAAVVIGFAWVGGADATSLQIIAVLALGLPLGAFSVFDVSFQATLQSQYAVAARVAGLALASLLRIVFLLLDAPVLAFAAASAIELATVGIAFAVLYGRLALPLRALQFHLGTARRLVVMSWPFLASAMAAAVYLKIDQIMLQNMVGSREVGVYAAAARLSEMWYFIPIALSSSMFPMLVAQRMEDPRAYSRGLGDAFGIVLWIAIPLAVGTTIIATPLIGMLYGAEYARTDDILRVHMWAAPFIFMNVMLGRALILEGRRGVELSRHVTGAVVNIALNLLLIPLFHGMGAAVATLVSYAVASYFVCFAIPSLRPHGLLMSQALGFPLRLWAQHTGTSGGAATLQPHPAPPLPALHRGDVELSKSNQDTPVSGSRKGQPNSDRPANRSADVDAAGEE